MIAVSSEGLVLKAAGSMIASRASSQVDSVIFFIGLVLMGSGVWWAAYNTTLGENRIRRSIVISAVIVGFLLMWAGYNQMVIKLANMYLFRAPS